MGLGILAETSLLVRLGILIGVLPLLAGIWYAIRPDERRLMLMRPLSLAAIFQAIASLLSGLANALYYVSTRAAAGDSVVPLAFQALAEAAIPCFLGFAFLTVAWLAVAIGTRRSALR